MSVAGDFPKQSTSDDQKNLNNRQFRRKSQFRLFLFYCDEPIDINTDININTAYLLIINSELKAGPCKDSQCIATYLPQTKSRFTT